MTIPTHIIKTGVWGVMDNIKTRLRNLDAALNSSFSKIKDEMGDLRVKLEFQLTALKETKKEFEDSKKDFVGIDKINVLKIKIGDLKEELKIVERLENRLKEIEKNAADREQTEAKINEIKDQLDAVEKISSASASKNRLEKLVKEMNEAFSQIKSSISDIEERGGSVVRERLHKIDHDIDRKIAATANKSNVLLEEIKKYPTKQDINRLLREINGEFDSLKEQLEEVKLLRNDLKNMRREKVGKKSLEEQFVIINGEIGNLKMSVEEMRKKGFKFKNANGESRGKRFNFYFFANFLIVLAFILLGASLALFFTGHEGYMDYLIYGAIASFVLGVLTRIVMVIKER